MECDMKTAIHRRDFLHAGAAAGIGLSIAPWLSRAAAADSPAGSKPNIILIMCDDAGFADFGYTGGMADTPVLDKLAAEGMRFTRAYTNARCMPTRCSLMTGLNPQLAGENNLNNNCVSIPEVLKEAGYANYMIGKWHLGDDRRIDRETKLQSTPIGRGYDRFYGIWAGAAFPNKAKMMRAEKDRKGAPRLIDDNRELEWDEVPDDYYNTTTWTDKAIEFIESTPENQPFFLYAAYTPPHWPLDPQPEYIARYEGRFDEGWDTIREGILQRQKAMGLIPPDYPMPPLEYGIEPFSEEYKDLDKYKKGCATYYASITEMDEQIGRMLDTVKKIGRGDNTLVIFFSDNGPDNLIGGPPRGNTSAMPFMGYKLTYYEGGACTPLVVWWPGVVPANTINHGQQVMLEDYMATFVELAGATYPTERLGQPIHPMSGRSILNALRDPKHADPLRIWCWSHDGQRGVWKDDWKAVMVNGNHPALKSYYKDSKDGWYLYKHDPHRMETPDISDKYPEKLKEMIGIWNDWAKSVNWSPSPRWNLHPTDAANGISDYGRKK